jgi:RimJ/RimL family protein N-acetyltransferase
MKLETKRLIIRDPIINDFKYIWEMRNDPEVSQFTGGVTSFSKDKLYQNHVKRCKNKSNTPKEYSVVLKSTGEYIGYCGFQLCEVLGGIEILYGFSKIYWGKGYATEATKAVLKYGKESLALEKIYAAVNLNNQASEKVLLNSGMKYIETIEYPNDGKVKKYVF